MTNSILSSILSKSVVSIINEANNLPVWTGIKVQRVDTQSDSNNSDVPLSSQQVSDTQVSSELLASDIETGKILQPTHLRLHVMTDNISVLENIIALYSDPTVTLTVTSKSILSRSMAISNVEFTQSSDVLSAAQLIITLEQVRLTQAVQFDPSQPSDQNNFGLSIQIPSAVSSNLGSIKTQAGQIVNTVGSAVSSLYNKFATSIGL